MGYEWLIAVPFWLIAAVGITSDYVKVRRALKTQEKHDLGLDYEPL